jgi:hypothetical protein
MKLLMQSLILQPYFKWYLNAIPKLFIDNAQDMISHDTHLNYVEVVDYGTLIPMKIIIQP